VLPIDGPAEEAKCEDLEKFAIGDDQEKFFRLGLNYRLMRRKS